MGLGIAFQVALVLLLPLQGITTRMEGRALLLLPGESFSTQSLDPMQLARQDRSGSGACFDLYHAPAPGQPGSHVEGSRPDSLPLAPEHTGALRDHTARAPPRPSPGS